MRRVIQSDEYQSQANLQNIVLEQSDIDKQFEDKIMENKQLLKYHRAKNVHTLSKPKIGRQIELQKSKQSHKKLSLIQNKIQKPLRKLKSKSLFPPINSVSSKVLNIPVQNLYRGKLKNESQKKIIFKHQIEDHHKKQQKHKKLHVQKRYFLQQGKAQNFDETKKDHQFKRKLTEVKKNSNHQRKLTELKLQSKIQDLKNKLGQRASGKQSKSRVSQTKAELQPRKKTARYSSNSVFDNIQDFLSNPHENNTKSQRKYMRLEEKIDKSSHIRQKQRSDLNYKIRLIEERIQSFNPGSEGHNLLQNHTNANLMYGDDIRKPTISTDSSPPQFSSQTDYGTIQWRRLQRNGVNKSDFQKQLKHVISLQQKGEQILRNYVQNHKILHQLQMIRRTQQMLNKNTNKSPINLQKQSYSSL